MVAFTIYPAIDLSQGRVVRLRQGDPRRKTEYSLEPALVARRWLSARARFLHVVNLDSALGRGDDDNQLAIREILDESSCWGVPIQLGGGLRTLEQVERWLQSGVRRVVLGTAAVDRPKMVAEAVRRFGAERVAVSLDTRGGIVQVHGWSTDSGREMVVLGKELAACGLHTLIHTDVSRDGLGAGVDVTSAQALAEATGLQVIASGGVNSLEDIRQSRRAGLAGIIIGRALYEGLFSLEEASTC